MLDLLLPVATFCSNCEHLTHAWAWHAKGEPAPLKAPGRKAFSKIHLSTPAGRFGLYVPACLCSCVLMHLCALKFANDVDDRSHS